MPNPPHTLMQQEALEAPAVVARQLDENAALIARLASRFRGNSPRFVSTTARGSSEHAATYAKYLFETRLGLPMRSAAPSTFSVYARPMDLRGSIMLCISQSGSSFDLVESAEWARRCGAFVLSLLNTPDSPLGAASDEVIPVWAGEEKSVAATKSHIASLSALLALVAHWTHAPELIALLPGLPKQLQHAASLNWSSAAHSLHEATSLLVAGRGLGLCVAQEAALKFKETCSLHAEAFSSAELLHGPVALVRDQFPVLLFSQDDATQAGTGQLARNLHRRGAQVFAAGLSAEDAASLPPSQRLPIVPGVHSTCAPLTLVQTYYNLANAAAALLGCDPDAPPHLQKVTQTR